MSLAKKDTFQNIFRLLNKGKKVKSIHLGNIYMYKEELEIQNILMIDKNGKILYSSDDKNLINVHVSEITQSFAQSFETLKTKPKKIEATFITIGYNKSSSLYKQFVITPLKGVDGYIAIEIDHDKVQKIIKNVASLGSTAETYLTYKYQEKTFLASKRVVKHGKIGDKKENIFIEKGFVETGVDIKYGSTDTIELVGYSPVIMKNIILSMQTTVTYIEVISPKIKGSDYFEQFVKDYKYQNMMLIGPKGDIFYSANKDDVNQADFLTSKYEDTHLSKAIKKALISKKFLLTDIDFYDKCCNKLAQFALLPILNENKTLQSIVVLELNLNHINKTLKRNSNTCKTYDAYLVGSDKRLRSDTILSPDKFNMQKSFKENLLIDTEGDSTAIIKDYRGINVLSSFALIEYPNFQWIVITKLDEQEIEDMLSSLKLNILFFVLISSLVALVVMMLITNEKKKQDLKLNHAATHDSLTGLPNRKFALEYLMYILANAKRMKSKGAVLFIDLDKFKVLNDSYGHKAGDVVLKEIALRFQSLLREDDLIGRLGGDEFIIIVNHFNTLHDIDNLCKKIILDISKQVKDEKKTYQVGVSIGISVFPDDSKNAEELLQFADTAMFKTKDNGRNGFTYYSKEMTEESLQMSRVESELSTAIKKNELVLHYQPQVSLITSKVIAVEALVRWNHPRDGLIMPNDFIPIAEESPLIVELGYWVIYEACKKFKKWQSEGLELEYIAVNMSIKQLQCIKCVKNIRTILEDLDFNPKNLELEITENTLISSIDSILININLFKEMGIKFSIDDFGTGYSSLSYLKSLRITTLKIDREFIKDLISDKDDRAIVEAIIVMGHMLNYRIVAEGAETKAEVELLRYFACDIVQGDYYSKPLPENDLIKYINGLNNDK